TYTDGNKQGRKYFTNVKSLYQGNDLAEIQRVQKKMEELGYEGTMLDDINAYYTTTRTKTLLKFKTFYSADLKVLRVVEHIRGGKLGSIVVEYKGNELYVGSGFTEKQRVKYWQEPELIINKIVEVGYFEESSDIDGNLSLRFPTFKQIREDKTVYDVSYH
ncbi:ligase, partial [Staphylococcus pseudintermedius]|nr:ligase [Staphylococcus pseudintermedius]